MKRGKHVNYSDGCLVGLIGLYIPETRAPPPKKDKYILVKTLGISIFLNEK